MNEKYHKKKAQEANDEKIEVLIREASVAPEPLCDELGNRYEQVIVDGKLTLKLVESASGVLNI